MSLNGNSASFGPNFDCSCANNGTKTKIGTTMRNLPKTKRATFRFCVLFAQKPSKLGPNGPLLAEISHIIKIQELHKLTVKTWCLRKANEKCRISMDTKVLSNSGGGVFKIPKLP